MTKKNMLFTQMTIKGVPFDPITLGWPVDKKLTQESFLNVIDAYVSRQKYDYDRKDLNDLILLLDILYSETTTTNLNFTRSITVGPVVMVYHVLKQDPSQ